MLLRPIDVFIEEHFWALYNTLHLSEYSQTVVIYLANVLFCLKVVFPIEQNWVRYNYSHECMYYILFFMIYVQRSLRTTKYNCHP